MSCEDFPCCGHESGCCPTFVDGEQMDMRCTCGASVPLGSRSSICDACFDEMNEDEPEHESDDEDYDDSMDGDHESGLASAGWGTDEDYGCYGGDEYGMYE